MNKEQEYLIMSLSNVLGYDSNLIYSRLKPLVDKKSYALSTIIKGPFTLNIDVLYCVRRSLVLSFSTESFSSVEQLDINRPFNITSDEELSDYVDDLITDLLYRYIQFTLKDTHDSSNKTK